jgi:hypothetical protein
VSNIKKLAAGEQHSLLLTREEKILTFGSNHVGQCGLGITDDHIVIPKQIQTLYNVFDISQYSIIYTTCFNIKSTELQVCNGNGYCEELDKCDCDKGYRGLNCSNHLCFGVENIDPNVCNSQGKCITVDKCECNSNYSGFRCQHPKCFGRNEEDPLICNGKGKCVSPDKCNCDKDYRGNNCSIPLCYGIESIDPNVCNGQGKIKII